MKYDGKNAEELIKRGLLSKHYEQPISTQWGLLAAKKSILDFDIPSLYIPGGIVEFYVFTSAAVKNNVIRLRVKEL